MVQWNQYMSRREETLVTKGTMGLAEKPVPARERGALRSMELDQEVSGRLDGSTEPLLVASISRRILRVNRPFTALTGWDEGEVIGMFCNALVDALASNGKRLCRKICQKILHDGGNLDALNRTVKIMGKGRRRIPVRIHHALVENNGSGPVIVIAMAPLEPQDGDTDFFDHSRKLFTMLRKLSDSWSGM